MKVTAFPAGDGDSLLVESGNGRMMLVDGGRSGPYQEHVRPALAALQRAGTPLELVCVSHIDDDHINGVVQLMDDLVAWAVHDFQVANGNPKHKPPAFPRPPDVKAVWHNGFSDQLKDNAGDVERMLSQSAAVLAGSDDERLRNRSHHRAAIAQGVRQAVRLSKRLGSGQLGIPLNPQFDGRMVLSGRGDGRLKLGTTRISVLAPTADELVKLRREWDAWLRKEQLWLREARAEAREDERKLGNELTRLVRPLEAQARVFGERFGNRGEVTAPNLASIVLLLEEGDATALLTGDSHSKDILAGLKRAGRLDADGRCHVNLLKVQHHGAEHNAEPGFFGAVTADHYLVCADGANENPHEGIVDMLLKERLKSGPGRQFTLWCTYSTAVTEGSKRAQLRKVERVVDKWRASHPNAFKVKFRGLPGAPKGKLTISL